ncbi:HNH endonuclease [Hymenobacter siberiensis]|uniref:HNH endonuclease n=1 Tax=Hymenobacter siberiensis TaxID=2848396 RepID=UPI001C1E2374|nr:HNH endonuclease [Hymenobacter siberiensis]
MKITLSKIVDGVEVRQIPAYPKYWISSTGGVIGARGKWLKTFLNSGYKKFCLAGGNLQSVHRHVAELWVENPKPDEYFVVDHIDRHRGNNDYNNLRWTTPRGNSQNLPPRINSKHKSGFVGVHIDPRREKGARYQALIRIDGHLKHLGLFWNAEDAANCYDNALEELGFPRVNFPQHQ